MPDMNLVKELTFYMRDKTDDELWDIIEEACRASTPLWRAYEVLRSRYMVMKQRVEANDRSNSFRA